MKIISDVKLTGSLRMFRIHITKKYHLCFMRNTSYSNGKKGYTVSLMRKYTNEPELGAYTPVINLLNLSY